MHHQLLEPQPATRNDAHGRLRALRGKRNTAAHGKAMHAAEQRNQKDTQ